jgi:hypothetical protein
MQYYVHMHICQDLRKGHRGHFSESAEREGSHAGA